MYKRNEIKEHLSYMMKDSSLTDKTLIVDTDTQVQSILIGKVKKQMENFLVDDRVFVNIDDKVFIDTAKFTILVIAFLFSEHNEGIDKKHQKIINKIVSRHLSLFNKDDVDELVNHMTNEINFQYLVDFSNTHALNQKTLSYVFHIVKKNIKITEKVRLKLVEVKGII